MNLRVVVPILAVAVVAVGYQNWRFFRENALSPAVAYFDEGDGGEPYDEDVSDGEMRAVLPENLDRYLAGLGVVDRNPFGMVAVDAPLPGVVDANQALILDGTLVGRERRIAWLDGVSRTEGSPIGGYRISAIGPAWIDLEAPGIPTFRVELGESVETVGSLANEPSEGSEERNDSSLD